jgi:hypothetical protein
LSDELDAAEIEAQSALAFLQAIYRSGLVPMHTRMRAAAICLPFETPKLPVTAHVTGDDFAARLERAIARSGVAPKMIEIEATSNQKGATVSSTP